jgi:hypothetical protein
MNYTRGEQLLFALQRVRMPLPRHRVQLLDNLRYFAFLPHMAFKKQVGERGCARPAVARRHKHNAKLRHFVDAVHGENGLEAR